jgi:hypothetical protein
MVDWASTGEVNVFHQSGANAWFLSAVSCSMEQNKVTGYFSYSSPIALSILAS